MTSTPGGGPPGPNPGDFWLTYAVIEETSQRWAETAEVVSTAADGVRAFLDGWSPTLRADVDAFVRVWGSHLEGLSATAQSTQTRLTETVAAYRRGDDAIAAATRDACARAGSSGVRPV